MIDFNKCSEKEKQYLLEELNKDRYPIKIVKDPSIKVQLAALGLPFPNAIKSVSFIEEDLTPDQKHALYREALRLDAVRQNSDAIKDFNNPSEEVIKVSKMSAIEKMKYFCKE